MIIRRMGNIREKQILLLLCFASISFISFSQQRGDTTYRRRIGLSLTSGIGQADFSPLRQYPYLLNIPTNNYNRTVLSYYLGPIEKIFITAQAAITYAYKKGTDNNYSIAASNFTINPGLLLTVKAYRNNANKIIRAIYPSIGLSFPVMMLNSIASGKAINGKDTSFYYERSLVRNTLISAEVMIEFPALWKDNYKRGRTWPLTLKLGYNFQYKNSIWQYDFSHATLRDPSNDAKINLGGFYVTAGFNLWAFTKY